MIRHREWLAGQLADHLAWADTLDAADAYREALDHYDRTTDTLRAPIAALLRRLADPATPAAARQLTEAQRLDIVELVAVLDENGLLPADSPPRPGRAQQLNI